MQIVTDLELCFNEISQAINLLRQGEPIFIEIRFSSAIFTLCINLYTNLHKSCAFDTLAVDLHFTR